MTLFAETRNGSVAQTNRFHRLVLSDNSARALIIMLWTLRPREEDAATAFSTTLESLSTA